MPFDAGGRVRSYKIWVSGSPLKPKCLCSLYMIFAFSSAALRLRGLTSLNQKQLFGGNGQAYILTSAWTFKESLVGLRSGAKSLLPTQK